MIRRWALRPDRSTGVVSREAVVEYLIEAESLLDKCGGVLSVIVDRQRTDLKGEAVTVGVVFEWKDRTDARDAPEPETRTVPRQEEPPPPEFEWKGSADPAEPEAQALVAADVLEDADDNLPPSEEELAAEREALTPDDEEEPMEEPHVPEPEPQITDGPVLPFGGGATPQPTARTHGQPEPDPSAVVIGPDGEPEEDLSSIPAGAR